MTRVTRLRICGVTALGLVVFAVLSLARMSDSTGTPLYLDPSQPVSVRVDDLVSRMTLEEKVSQLVNQSRAIPRLKVPRYDWRSEALHGIAGPGIATVFPEPIGLAATFDAPLIREMAGAVGAEGRARYNKAVREGRRSILEGLDFWAPNINIARDPRWGRAQETYGEDPFLTARMAVAFVTGMQGDDPKYRQVIATPKHFAVHSGPEPSRHVMNVDVSKHDMQDTYLPAFRAAIVEANAGSVMCAYNRVNGDPACANTYLLQDQLRGAWNFDGYVVGDCDSVEEIYSAHHFTKTFMEAAALSLKRGLDNECIDSYAEVTDNGDYIHFLNGVAAELINEQDVDIAVKRLVTARFRLGEFDAPEAVRYARLGDSEIDSEAHRRIALQSARESMVLLKNDGILPLSSRFKKIAVLGPSAASQRVLLGNYNGTPSRVTTGLDGLRKMFPHAQITFAPGLNLLREESLVPASAFLTTDGNPGLAAEYYPNKDFSGRPSLLRTDPFVNLEPPPLTANSLPQPPGPTEFSVRWTGVLVASESGTYQIRPTASSSRLWLDGKLVIDTSTPNSDAEKIAIIQLEKGKRYEFKLESVDRDDGGATLVWLPLLPNPLLDAIAAASSADLILFFGGISSQLEGEELQVNIPGFKGGDRTTLDLPEEEEKLLHALRDTGKPLVVVLMNGSALSINWAEKNANAILEAWYPGEEGGLAIAETLAGLNNPAGRLPVTFYASTDQLPPFESYSMNERTYRYFSGQPLYAFGYGLSYSKFGYANLKLSSKTLRAGEPLDVSVDVANLSSRNGDEVVELYLNFPDVPGVPLRALRGIQRVHLAAGARQHVRLTLRPRDLSMVDGSGGHVIVPGAYRITAGGGQPGATSASVSATFQVRGQQKLPD